MKQMKQRQTEKIKRLIQKFIEICRQRDIRDKDRKRQKQAKRDISRETIEAEREKRSKFRQLKDRDKRRQEVTERERKR